MSSVNTYRPDYLEEITAMLMQRMLPDAVWSDYDLALFLLVVFILKS